MTQLDRDSDLDGEEHGCECPQCARGSEAWDDEDAGDDADDFDAEPRYKAGSCRFTQAQRDAITAAADLAEKMVKAGLERARFVHGTTARFQKKQWRDIPSGFRGWSLSPLHRWFGPGDLVTRPVVFAILKRMKSKLDDGLTFKPGVRRTTSRGAISKVFTFGGVSRRIRVMPEFFDRSRCFQALELLLALAHFGGALGRHHGHENSRTLKTWRKRHNAANYAYYCASMFYGERGRSQADVQALFTGSSRPTALCSRLPS